MSYWLDEGREQHEFVTVRTLWVTITLSVLVHLAALLLVLQQTHLLAPFDEATDQVSERLQVRLTPKSVPAPPPAPEPAREIAALPKAPMRAPRPAVRPEPSPPVIASTAPGPAIPQPVVPAPPAPPAPGPPAKGDLWDYLQARRRERGEAEAPAAESQQAEPNVNLAANLPTAATGVAATQDRRRGGGIFEIKRMDYDDAAFMFYGWNKDMGRRTPQLIEVRKGDNSDMCIAVVRRMISIIREHEKGDFFWESPRREHDVVLSARPADNAVLEQFLSHDFCDELGVRR